MFTFSSPVLTPDVTNALNYYSTSTCRPQ